MTSENQGVAFPIEFPKCPNCGCKDTVMRLACADEPSIPKGSPVSMERKITPTQDFTKISTPTTKILLRHYDTCARCGLDYCTRVDKTTMPTDALMRMMGLVPVSPQPSGGPMLSRQQRRHPG